VIQSDMDLLHHQSRDAIVVRREFRVIPRAEDICHSSRRQCGILAQVRTAYEVDCEDTAAYAPFRTLS
jgi:hypothetical protein